MFQKTGVIGSNESRRLQQYREMSKGCSMFEPCPINMKCMNKASHLYVKCQNCPVPHATHNHKARSWAIRRENFAITVTDETGKKFIQAVEEKKAELKKEGKWNEQ